MLFTLPAVPAALTQPAERAEYVVRHYWDSVEWGSVSEDDATVIEGAFADYATVLPLLPEGERGDVLTAWLAVVQAGGSDAWEMVKRLGRLYLYQYDSPVYDVELYLDFAEAAAALDSADVRLSADAEALAVGRPGGQVIDMALVDGDGLETSLRRVAEGAGEVGTMVIFYSPDCRDCHELRDRLVATPPAEQVVAVYVGDDIEAWRRDLPTWPAGWSVTRAVDGDEVPYLIRRTPTVYWIGGEGVVVRREL